MKTYRPGVSQPTCNPHSVISRSNLLNVICHNGCGLCTPLRRGDVHALHANQHFGGLPHDPAVSLVVTNLKEGERYREFYWGGYSSSSIFAEHLSMRQLIWGPILVTSRNASGF